MIYILFGRSCEELFRKTFFLSHELSEAFVEFDADALAKASADIYDEYAL